MNKQNKTNHLIPTWIDELSKVLLGKKDPIRLVLACFLARGHVLIEDVPGTGKTLLSKAMAKSLGLKFSRIQFTPDLLPTDVMGLTLFDRKEQEFKFHPGPLFSDIVLSDEVNRATPRTQSAMLEAMAERQITVDGKTHPLSPYFFVLATENPIDYEGTFPLPEAQLDRFMVRLDIGYPDEENEMAMLNAYRIQSPLDHLQAVVSKDQIDFMIKEINQVTISADVQSYIIRLIRSTRTHPRISLGVSPRGSLALQHLSMAWAYIQGRDYVLPDDIKELAIPALSHRLMISVEARIKREKSSDILQELLEEIPVIQP